ncbi:MAG: DUF6171 family protein [Lachnospiraceae bacterium]|nr:DUF6171 family protein [Robinsoniella sp.]MDY3767179.1 DUF6171 family protein [Lachnospiraceae bacterium]
MEQENGKRREMFRETGGRRPCRKCLLIEVEDEAYEESIQRYLSNLAEDQKADESLYQQRLMQCQKCEYLYAGMCRLCGCYVEVRAAQKGRKCPDVKRRW